MSTYLWLVLYTVITTLINTYFSNQSEKRAILLTKMIAFERTQNRNLFPELGDHYFFFYNNDPQEIRPEVLSNFLSNDDFNIFNKKQILKMIKSEKDITVVNLFNETVNPNSLVVT